jgi:adenosylcobinamide-GDP ribazoletransferase
MARFGRAIRVLPIAGAVIAAPAAAVLLAGAALGISPGPGAALALATLVLVSGAMHEDGLADTADGFGGGETRDCKLAIMKDSRIGSFGAAALMLSLLIRWSALAELAGIDAGRAAAGLVAAAAVSRTLALVPLACLTPARAEGASRAAARPERGALAAAGLLAAGTAGGATACGIAPLHAAAALVTAGLAALAVTWLSARQIGGQTGDVAGAAQQCAEAAFLVTLCARI